MTITSGIIGAVAAGHLLPRPAALPVGVPAAFQKTVSAAHHHVEDESASPAMSGTRVGCKLSGRFEDFWERRAGAAA